MPVSSDVLYVQIHTDKPERLAPDDWHPWTKCDGDRKQTMMLAAHRFVRVRGGLGDADALSVHVYSYWKGSPEHRPGFPVCVDYLHLVFHAQTLDGCKRALQIKAGR